MDKSGWLIRKGAMPRPVELPTPRRRRMAGASLTAVSGGAHLCRMFDQVDGKGANQPDRQQFRLESPGNSGRSAQISRSAAPICPTHTPRSCASDSQQAQSAPDSGCAPGKACGDIIEQPHGSVGARKNQFCSGNTPCFLMRNGGAEPVNIGLAHMPSCSVKVASQASAITRSERNSSGRSWAKATSV